ncbi:hypothetical protein ACKTEK_03045 [Tepidamorphus sp. 3E244]|uniref:hypothetical protein n=1 Tax=Tepidamorphus sp. 3E244 TaxID=3385498 RepID=UPI0038FC2666
MTRLVQLGLLYGVLGFAAGFVFGALRELVLIPHLGERFGQQVEFPLVAGAVAIIGCWMARRFGERRSAAWLLGLGVLGVATLVAIESVFSLVILGRLLEDYLASYDLTAGSLFPVGLAIMALAPVFSRSMERFG